MNKLFNPDYLQFLCQKYGLKPSKKYGQNFLIDPEPIEKMLEAGQVDKNDAVIEIGPGFGVLTFALSEKVKEIIAYEIEKKLIPYWEKHKPENVQIEWGNVLKSQKSKVKSQKHKVVANLPYQITSALIRTFLESDNPPELMVLMVQKEVAERICAKKGQMSLLSVAVQYYADPEIVAIVPHSYFWPEPKVDSAIIKLKVHNLPAGGQKSIKSEEFFRLVKAGFANRRKLLIKNLEVILGKKNKEKLKEIFAELGLQETVRAQELGVEDWINIVKILSSK